MRTGCYTLLLSLALLLTAQVGLGQVPLPAPDAVSRAYPVQHTHAGALAPRLRQLLAQASHSAEVVIDRTNNRLIVKGSESSQRMAAETIAALDVRATSDDTNDQATLSAIRVEPQRLHSVAQHVALQYRQNVDVRITADDKTGQVLIMAPATLQPEIQSKVNEVLRNNPDIQQVSASVGQPVRAEFALQRASWRDFEDGLVRLAGRKLPVTTQRNGELASFDFFTHQTGKTNVQVDRRENRITVVAPKVSISGWRRVVEAIDQSDVQSGTMTQMMRLENAQPGPIRRAVTLMRNTQLVAAGQDDAIGVAGGDRNNPLLRAVMQRQAARQNGQGQGQADANQGGDDDKVTGVASAGADKADAFSGLFGDVQIEFVPELGVIIVRGAKRDVQRVMEVINQIEAQSAVTQPKVEVVPLVHANSTAVATIVNQLYEQVLAPRQGQVSITSLDKPNAILLIGREEAVAGVIDLIKKVDQPVDAQSQFKVFNLKHASALDVQNTIQGFFVQRPGSEDDLRGGLGTRVRIIADYRTNSIIAQASPRDMQEVEQIVAKLDVPKGGAQSEIKVFRLKNAFADDLQPVLQAAINGVPEDQPENTEHPSTTLSMLSVDSAGNKVLDSGILTGVVVTADPNVNAIVVRAPGASMPLIGELINQLDQLPGAESVVKVFTIVNGDATQLSTSLQELFAATGQTGGTNGNLAALAQSTGGETSLVPLRFGVDVRTNSIIASGSMTDLEVVESLLLRLDTDGFSSRITETIWLRNAHATDVALALQDFVAQQLQLQQRNQFYSQGLGPYDLPERDLVVAPEQRTNSLIISVSPRLYDSVRRVIDQLDRRPPMIMIQVVLAEIKLTDGFEFGTELGIQDSILFDRGIANAADPPSIPGFNFIPNPGLGSTPGLPNLNTVSQGAFAGQAASAFAMGRQSGEFGYGGFVLSAASESVNLLLRTLQDAGRAQILSRPQIMTLDGTEGYVQVGADFPRITNVSFSGINALPIISTTDEAIGLILRVLPRVGQDGLIVMNIDARRSNIDPIQSNGQIITTDTNGNPIYSPQILITQAQSTITAHNGQTVVFGGLITKDRRQFSRRVPYISNIPILGHLFRYDQEIEERTEMLIIMTPRIVNGEEDQMMVNEAESSRMSYCLADVVEMHGDAGLRGGYGLWGPAVGAMIYPDLQPTIDHLPSDIPAENMPPLAPGETMVPGTLQEYPASVEQPISPQIEEPVFMNSAAGAIEATSLQQSVNMIPPRVVSPPQAVGNPVGNPVAPMSAPVQQAQPIQNIPNSVSVQAPVLQGYRIPGYAGYTPPGYRAPGNAPSGYSNSEYASATPSSLNQSPMQSTPGYQQASPGYQQSMPGYQQSSPGYQQSMLGYQQSTPGYQQSMPVVQQPIAQPYSVDPSSATPQRIAVEAFYSPGNTVPVGYTQSPAIR